MLRGRFQSEARRMRTAMESSHPQLIQDALPAETIEGVLDSLQVKSGVASTLRLPRCGFG